MFGWKAGVVMLAGVYLCVKVLKCTCNSLATGLQLDCNPVATRFSFVLHRVARIMYFQGYLSGMSVEGGWQKPASGLIGSLAFTRVLDPAQWVA